MTLAIENVLAFAMVLVVASCSTTGSVETAGGASRAGAAEWDLQIVPTKVWQEKQDIDSQNKDSAWFVVLTNISKKDMSVWREWCSWGYFSLSFTIIVCGIL